MQKFASAGSCAGNLVQVTWDGGEEGGIRGGAAGGSWFGGGVLVGLPGCLSRAGGVWSLKIAWSGLEGRKISDLGLGQATGLSLSQG